MKQLVSKQLLDYWRGLKGARAAPESNEIELGAIRQLLAHVFMIQLDRAGRFPMQMCGTRINALWLTEQRGRSFLDFWDERDHAAIHSALATATSGARPVVMGARGGAGDTQLDLELLFLPLGQSDRGRPLVLGSFAFVNEPDWIGRKPAGALRVHSCRMVRTQTLAPSQQDARLLPARPRLVLYEGGKYASSRLRQAT